MIINSNEVVKSIPDKMRREIENISLNKIIKIRE